MTRAVLGLSLVMVAAVAHAAAPKLEVTLVGHEGFLLRSGKASVLIDGFLRPGKDVDDDLSPGVYEKMLAGTAPFVDVGTALVSHAHHDHFDPTVAGTFLEKHPETVFAVSTDIAAEMKTFPRHEAVKGQIVEEAWDAHHAPDEAHAVHADLVHFKHEASTFYAVDVAMFVVEINGLRVLHAADAELEPAHLNALHLEAKRLDLAILPYSFFTSPDAVKVFKEHIRARRVLWMHVPPGKPEQTRALVLKFFPNSVFLKKPLDSVAL